MSSISERKCCLLFVMLCGFSFVTNHLTDLCPKDCVCSADLLRVDCTNLHLTAVPSNISTKTVILNLASNSIKTIPDYAFQNLSKLNTLYLKNNEIESIGPKAFEGLVALNVLTLSDNKIDYLPKNSFLSNKELTLLELSGNPIETFHQSTFSNLPHLKKLILSEVRHLQDFPDIKGTFNLEHLRIDRANLNFIPSDLCEMAPKLRSLNLKSNKLDEIPVLTGCKDLRLIDLSYNNILVIEDDSFANQANLIDLFMSHNLISKITNSTFKGLINLQVLDLESNNIEYIHPNGFSHFKDLRDLNLGENTFPKLPTKGLQNLRQLKTFNNRQLKEFPSIQTFPRINTLALSYAYHCCAFIATSNPRISPGTSLQETIVWLSKDDVDMSSWNSNLTDTLTESGGNFSSKFEEFANELWKTFRRDYTIPDNLPQYAEGYFEDYKAAINHEVNAKFNCYPEPGPFMPCEDLFGWWSLRCGVWVVFLLALLGNGVVVIVLVIGRSKMDVPRFLVCNLASADFFMGVYLGMLAVVDASTLGEFKVSAISWQTSIGCQTAGFFAVLSTELSVFTLSVITLERNYAITHAMHLNKRLSLAHAAYIMFIGWFFAVSMAVLPFFGISDYKKFAICLPFETEDVWSLTYVVFLIHINGVAFLILMGCYLKMYCAIRGSQAWNSNDSRIARRMALLVVTDFICWAPIAFFSLTAVCGLQLISLEEAKVFAIFVLPLNSCANPFLYAIFTKQFKKDCIHICKRIEESRVTRGIGRGRHSSNFSNRHTPITTNSSETDQQRLSTDICQCNKRPKSRSHIGWKEWALKYFFCKKYEDHDNRDGYRYAIAQIQRSMEKRNKHTTSISSENFSSRSDSWRQGTIPLRLLDSETRRSFKRKVSEDSNMSCSRQDSSTSTFHMSRSSFSSESTSQPKVPPGNQDSFRDKPKLCRQGAVSDDIPRHIVREKTIDGLCPICAKKRGVKSKELDEKFTGFYNRLVDTSCNKIRDTKEDRMFLTKKCQELAVEGNTLSASSNALIKNQIEINPKIVKTEFELPGENAVNNTDCESDAIQTKDGGNEKIDVYYDKLLNGKDKTSSENSLSKHSTNNLTAVFKRYESFKNSKDMVGHKEETMKPSLRSSKSENVMKPFDTECRNAHQNVAKDANQCSLLSEHTQSLLSGVNIQENHLKISNSSPNISMRNCEISPLIDSTDELESN